MKPGPEEMDATTPETTQATPPHTPPDAPPSLGLILLRYVLPAVVVLAGIVVMSLGREAELEGGAAIVSAGLAIYFLNWLFRTGAAGESEREAEDRAREHFDRHGRWPD